MNILREALGAGLVVGLLCGIAQLIQQKKPAFFWNLKPAMRVTLLFSVLFLLFPILIFNNSEIPKSITQSVDSSSSSHMQLTVGSNAAKHTPLLILNKNISTSGTVRCEPDRYVAAQNVEESTDVGFTYTLIDFDAPSMSRCDAKGCDTYEVAWQHAGSYINLQPKEPRGFLMKVSDKGEYFEMVSIELYPLLYFGKCWNLFEGV